MHASAILSFLLIVMSALVCRADDLTIVDVRSNIPLSEEEPAYKDFYLAGGDVSGLKKNLVITAVRKITVRDSKGAQAYGDIAIPVGQLKVIAVYGKVAVAREYKLLSRDENPMLEQAGIMSGDLVDLKESFVDSTKPAPPKKKSADVAEPAPVTTAAVMVAVPVAAAAPAPVRVAASDIEISKPEISRPEMSESGTSVYGAPATKKADSAALVEEPSSPAAKKPSKSPAALEEADDEPAHSSAKPVPVFKPVDHLPTGDE